MRRLIWVYAICKCPTFWNLLHKQFNHFATIVYIEFLASYAPVSAQVVSFHDFYCLLTFLKIDFPEKLFQEYHSSFKLFTILMASQRGKIWTDWRIVNHSMKTFQMDIDLQ